ncbi:hypothetical protein BYT27DRAFT_7124344 [Phlegmacium glaucopus]|nr:hypothetical protein BYT27DRAFT_7124344 [Phlegmacium glaucopus]
MKRSASPDSPEAKRIKICPESSPTATSLDHAPEQCALNIARHGVNQAGCILGSFVMIWCREKEIDCIVAVRSSTQETHRFHILFNTSEESLTTLTLSPKDEFRLSLYGAEIEKFPQIPKLSTLPLRLVYKKGVHIEWKPPGSEQMRKVNTWLCTLFSIALLLISMVQL